MQTGPSHATPHLSQHHIKVVPLNPEGIALHPKECTCGWGKMAPFHLSKWSYTDLYQQRIYQISKHSSEIAQYSNTIYIKSFKMLILIIISQLGIWHPSYPESSQNVIHYLVPHITPVWYF